MRGGVLAWMGVCFAIGCGGVGGGGIGEGGAGSGGTGGSGGTRGSGGSSGSSGAMGSGGSKGAGGSNGAGGSTGAGGSSGAGGSTGAGGSSGAGGTTGSPRDGGPKDASLDMTVGDVAHDVAPDGIEGVEGGNTCGLRVDGGGERFGTCGKGATCCPGGAFDTFYCTVVTDAGCPKVP